MTDETEVHDHSRVDKFMAARRKSMMMHAMWKPALAGAAGAGLIIAAVAVAQPKFITREVTVDHVVPHDVMVPVPRIVSHDVDIDRLVVHDRIIEAPRIVTPPIVSKVVPATPDERTFEETPEWHGAVIRGRILRSIGNGFVLMTDAGEQGFYPATVGADGKIALNPSARDDVETLIGSLARCNKLPIGSYRCVALEGGHEVEIRQVPIGRPL